MGCRGGRAEGRGWGCRRRGRGPGADWVGMGGSLPKAALPQPPGGPHGQQAGVLQVCAQHSKPRLTPPPPPLHPLSLTRCPLSLLGSPKPPIQTLRPPPRAADRGGRGGGNAENGRICRGSDGGPEPLPVPARPRGWGEGTPIPAAPHPSCTAACSGIRTDSSHQVLCRWGLRPVPAAGHPQRGNGHQAGSASSQTGMGC